MVTPRPIDLGLTSLRQRIELVHGTLRANTAPGGILPGGDHAGAPGCEAWVIQLPDPGLRDEDLRVALGWIRARVRRGPKPASVAGLGPSGCPSSR